MLHLGILQENLSSEKRQVEDCEECTTAVFVYLKFRNLILNEITHFRIYIIQC